MQYKRMHGDWGRYLVNMGEKYNLMIPWTKVQKKFIAHMVQTTQLSYIGHKPLFHNCFLIGPRDEKIQNPEEIRSKGPIQR